MGLNSGKNVSSAYYKDHSAKAYFNNNSPFKTGDLGLHKISFVHQHVIDVLKNMTAIQPY